MDLSDRRKERFKTTLTLQNVDFCCEEIDHLVPWYLTEIDLCDLYKSVFFLNFWRKVNITLLYIFLMYACGGEVLEFVTVIWFCFTHWNVFRLEHFGKSSRNLVFKNLDEMIEPTSVATLQWLVCAEYFSSRTFLWFNYVTLFLKYSAASSE